MRNSWVAGLAAGLLIGVALVQSVSAAQQAARPAFTIETLKAPSQGDVAAPQITVGGGKMLLSWLERSGMKAALKFAERIPAGWSQPTVVLESEHLITNFADVPSVRALADGSLVAHWIEMNGPDPEAYDLKIATSRDNGKIMVGAGEPSPGRHEDAARVRLVLQLRARASAWSGWTAARRSAARAP